MKNYSEIELIMTLDHYHYEGKFHDMKWFLIRVPVTTHVVFINATSQLINLCMN